MPKRRKMWVYSPPKQPKPKVPESVKMDLEKKAKALVETVLKPTYMEPLPEETRFNYIVDIYTKWYRSYFYFCAKYHSPGPNAISPFFEEVCSSGIYWKWPFQPLLYERHRKVGRNLHRFIHRRMFIGCQG